MFGLCASPLPPPLLCRGGWHDSGIKVRWKVTRKESKRSRRDCQCMSLPYTLIKKPRAACVARTQINLDAWKGCGAQDSFLPFKNRKDTSSEHSSNMG